MGYEDYESDYLEYRQKVDKVYIKKMMREGCLITNLVNLLENN